VKKSIYRVFSVICAYYLLYLKQAFVTPINHAFNQPSSTQLTTLTFRPWGLQTFTPNFKSKVFANQ